MLHANYSGLLGLNLRVEHGHNPCDVIQERTLQGYTWPPSSELSAVLGLGGLLEHGSFNGQKLW